MYIRPAKKSDAVGIINLLRQVLELHAKIRPDIFVSGTTKYTVEEVGAIIANEKRRTYIADDGGEVIGYALCELEENPATNNSVAAKTMYIDDICVDESARGQHIGEKLFDHVKAEATALGCDDITLNVWEGNDGAKAFYEKMGMTPRKTLMEMKIK